MHPVTIIIGILAICNLILGGTTFLYYEKYKDAVQFKEKAESIARQEQEYNKLIKHETDINLKAAIDKYNSDVKRLRINTSASVLPVARKPEETEICFDRTELDRTIQSYRSGVQELISIGTESQIDLDNAKEFFEKKQDIIEKQN